MVSVLATATAAAGLAVAVASADGGGSVTVRQSSSDLWATVNICHGKLNPPKMGIRAEMPVGSSDERPYMRFRAQFKRNGHWHYVDKGADSGWRSAYSGPFMSEQLGWTFKFKEPLAGQSFLMRGVVRFKWTQGGQVVRRATRVTTGGHPTGDAKHSVSLAHCRIVGPAGQ